MSDFPYPGLRSFERHETDIFFGREHHTDQLIAKLEQTHFLAVLGPSGCGKSSLVRTGLLADLEKGFMAQAGIHWRIAELRPSIRPFTYLAKALAVNTVLGAEYLSDFADLTEASAFLEVDLRRGPLGLHELLDKVSLPAQSNVLILVDQFEEIFRYYHQGAANEAAAFVALLLASSRHERVYIIITMRSDFLGDCALFAGLPEAINQGLFLTPSLNREQLRQVIEGPARVFEGQVEVALVNQLLNDVGEYPHQLPLLQHALMYMWNRACAKLPVILTLTHYQAIGGLATALSQHADKAYAELEGPQQKIAEILFRTLSERNPDRGDSRRPAQLAEIAILAQVHCSQIVEVIDVFRHPERSFLTPTYYQTLTPEHFIDISHESLIHYWQRLHAWSRQEAESAEHYQRLEDTALRWQAQKAELWSGNELEIALAWWQQEQPNAFWAQRYGRNGGEYFELAQQFLEKSVQKREKERKQAELRFKRELQRRRARKQVLWVFIGFLIVMGLLIIESIQLNRERQLREQAIAAQREAEQAKEDTTVNLFESQLTHAALLARVEDYAAARSVLKQTHQLDEEVDLRRHHTRNVLEWFVNLRGSSAQQTYSGVKTILYTVAVDPQGQWLAAGGQKGTLLVFERRSGKLIKQLQSHRQNIYALVFHPQGHWLASAGTDKQIIIWDLKRGKPILSWTAPDRVNALAVTPDGRYLASGGDDHDVTLWETEHGQRKRIFQGHQDSIAVGGLAFNTQGTLLASGAYDDTVRLWATTPGTFKQVFSGHANDVANVTFAAQRPLLASSSDDTTIRLWDVARGELVRVFYGHQNRVLGLRFVEADQYLVSASFDRTLRLWDRQSGTTLRVFQGHTATVNNIAVYEDQIFSASHDGTVRRWQVHLPYQTLVPLPAEALSVAIAPNGQYVAVGLKEGILCLYTIKTDTLWCQPPQPALKGVLRLAFHPQSQLLASIYLDDNLVKLWQLNQGRLNEYKTVHYPNAIRAVAFSPQGEQLALADNAGQVWLSTQFLSSQSQELSFSAHEDKIYSLTFNRQGNYLLSSGKEGYTRLWSLETSPPTLVRALPPAKDELMWATISPNNQLIASVGREQKAFVYAMGNQGYYSLPGHEQTIYRAAFSPDNQHLITASGDATVRFWDLTQRRELFTLRLPVVAGPTSPLWDFDFRCHAGVCWMAVPLTSGRLVVYRLPNVYTP